MQDERHETKKKMYHIPYINFLFSVAIHNINKLHTQGKKKQMCTEKYYTEKNKTRLNKNNYVTKTMKNKHMKHLTKKLNRTL